MSESAIALVMGAEIVLRPGVRLRFTPGIEASTGDDFQFRAFIKQYDNQICTIVELPKPRQKQHAAPEPGSTESILSIFEMMDDAFPRFKVKFEDGTEKMLKSCHLTAVSFGMRGSALPASMGERDPAGLRAYSAAIEDEAMQALNDARKLAGESF